MRSRTTLAVVALTALAAVLRFAFIGDQSVSEDESFTVSVAGRSFGDLLRELPRAESTPPLHFVLTWLWGQVAGTEPGTLRALSAVAGTATVPVAFLAGRELVAPRAGLVAAAIVTVSPLLVWYSQEARSYALLILLCGLSFLAFVRALDKPRRGPLAAWAGLSALALMTHYFAVFPAAAEGAWLLWRAENRRQVGLALAVPVTILLALAPLANRQRTAIGGADLETWADGQAQSLAERIVGLPRESLIGYYSPASRMLALALAALVAFAVASAFLRTAQEERRRAVIAISIVAVGVAVPVVAALAARRFDYVVTRFMLPVAIPAILIAAAGFAIGRRGLVAAAVFCGLSLVPVVAVALDERYQRRDAKGAIAALGPPAEARLIVEAGITGRPLLIYLPNATEQTTGVARVREIDVVVLPFPGQDEPPQLGTTLSPPGFALAGSARTRTYALRRYRSPIARRVSLRALRARVLGPLQVTGTHPGTILLQFPPRRAQR